MRDTTYADTEDLRNLLRKWKKTDQRLTKKELRQAMYAVEMQVSEVDNASWEHCNRLDIGWD